NLRTEKSGPRVTILAAKRRKIAAQGASPGIDRNRKAQRGEGNVAYTVPKLKDFSPAALDKAVEKLLSALEQESSELRNGDERKAFRDRWLGRKDGILTQINELWLKAAPKEAKREVGQRVNKLKTEVEAKVEAALKRTPAAGTESAIDISFPGIRRAIGAEHPIIRTQNRIVRGFKNLCYF